MIVTDTSALISLATISMLDTVLEEFDTHTTKTVIKELQNTKKYNDIHGDSATKTLENKNKITIHEITEKIQTSRIDKGEGSCGILTKKIDADFLLTDDLRAIPELQKLSHAEVAISPIMLKALQKKGILEKKQAKQKLDILAKNRDWLESPIYKKAKQLFKE